MNIAKISKSLFNKVSGITCNLIFFIVKKNVSFFMINNAAEIMALTGTCNLTK